MGNRSIHHGKELLFVTGALVEDVHTNIDDFEHVVILNIRLELLSFDLHKCLASFFDVLKGPIIFVFRVEI